MSKKLKQFVLPALSALAIVAVAASPSLATTPSTGGITQVEGMVTSLDGVADDAFPIAVGVTGFAVAVLLVKRALYA